MDFRNVLLICLATCSVTMVNAKISPAEEAEVDAIVAAIQADQPSWNAVSPVNHPLARQADQPSWNAVPHVNPPHPIQAVSQNNALPYEAARNNFYGSVGFHKPATTLSVSTGGLFAAQSEILRLVEAFLRFKGQLFSHFFAVINNNWELIRGITNFLISKVPHLHAFALKGVSVLRQILEFAVHTFSEWNISLPAFNFEASSDTYVQPPAVQPHATYGVPSLNVAGFLENVNHRR